jgi:hypothetical protein
VAREREREGEAQDARDSAKRRLHCGWNDGAEQRSQIAEARRNGSQSNGS